MSHSWGQDASISASTTPTIHVDAIAAGRGELEQEVRIFNVPCGGRYEYLNPPKTVGELEGGTVKAIWGVRFANRKTAPTHEELRDAMKKVWEGKFQSVSCQIDWEEANIWSIAAVAEFEDGQRRELITDGMHVALRDHDGKSRFLRLLPAAQ
jgi:hypothetical protein